MKRTLAIITATASLTAASTPVLAADISANIGWNSQYIFRGIFQSKSSAMGGVDLEAGGFYLGAWGADVDDGHRLPHTAVGNLVAEQPTRIFECEGFDIDNLGIEARSADGSLALLDILGTRRDEQDIHELGILFVGTDHFIVEADLFHRERYVLVRLDLNLPFEISLGKAGGHLDDFGNGRIAADCDGDVRGLGSRALNGATNCLADRLGVDDGFLAHRAWGRGLC